MKKSGITITQENLKWVVKKNNKVIGFAPTYSQALSISKTIVTDLKIDTEVKKNAVDVLEKVGFTDFLRDTPSGTKAALRLQFAKNKTKGNLNFDPVFEYLNKKTFKLQEFIETQVDLIFSDN